MADLLVVAPYSAKFLKDLASVWAERGRAAMENTAIDQPGVFFATCARLIGAEVKLPIEQTRPGNPSMEDWQVMREIVAAVRQAIPDASSKPPGAVLEHVLTALRAADAKVLDSSENNRFMNSQRRELYVNSRKSIRWRQPLKIEHLHSDGSSPEEPEELDLDEDDECEASDAQLR
jgi:hypothetical protein